MSNRTSKFTMFVPRLSNIVWGAVYYFIIFIITVLPCYASLQTELQSLFETQSPDLSEWSVLVKNQSSGKTVFSLSPESRIIPASNMKLVVCSAILLKLGPAFTYETKLYATGQPVDSNLNGDLIVVGSGDPGIGGRFNGGDITHTLREWAGKLKEKKIEAISGDIIGIDDVFDENRYGLNWHPDDYPNWYAAEISGLSFNDGCIDVIIKGGSAAGRRPSISLKPKTNYMTIENGVRTVRTRSGERKITFTRESKSTHLRITGALRARTTQTHWASVPNPTQFFCTVFKETLEDENIAVKGKAIDGDEVKQLPLHSEWKLVNTYRSPPLSQLLRVCLKDSQNLYAEHFLKTLGYHTYGEGSLKMGALAIKDVLFKNGCNIDKVFIADGSGLSRENRLSADGVIKILRCMAKSPHAKTFKTALSRSGIDGTLERRMRNTAAQGRVYGKTGTLNGVRSLSGYIKSKSGKEYLFSMIANGRKQAYRFSHIMDQACVLLAEKG